MYSNAFKNGREKLTKKYSPAMWRHQIIRKAGYTARAHQDIPHGIVYQTVPALDCETYRSALKTRGRVDERARTALAVRKTYSHKRLSK